MACGARLIFCKTSHPAIPLSLRLTRRRRLDEKTPLEEAHDVAETLQYCMEALDDVDRAFITVDYNIAGPTGHAPAP